MHTLHAQQITFLELVKATPEYAYLSTINVTPLLKSDFIFCDCSHRFAENKRCTTWSSSSLLRRRYLSIMIPVSVDRSASFKAVREVGRWTIATPKVILCRIWREKEIWKKYDLQPTKTKDTYFNAVVQKLYPETSWFLLRGHSA